MARIVAVVGLPGSGKTEAVAELEKFGFVKVYFGGITLETLKKRGLEINESNERRIREELRQKYGTSAYAKLSLPKIKELLARNKNVVIDGLYSWEEYLLLKKELPQLEVVAVYASPATRYQRLAKRPVRPLSGKEAQDRDSNQIEKLHQAGPIAMADYTIVNESEIAKLKNEVRRIVDAEGKKE